MTRKKAGARPQGPSPNDKVSSNSSTENEGASESEQPTGIDTTQPTSGGLWLTVMFLVPLVLLLVWGYLTR
jgi:hypothetical protein